MRLASLEPYLTDLVCSYGLVEELVAVGESCHGCDQHIPVVVKVPPPGESGLASARMYSLERSICSGILDSHALRAAHPEVIITQVPAEPELVPLVLSNLRGDLNSLCGREVSLFSYNPTTLDSVFEMYKKLAWDLGVPDKGLELAHRQKAQFMVWGDNFYERMKNKRISVIASLNPLKLAGLWVPDLIRLASAVSQAPTDGKPASLVEWREVVEWKPDVIVVAPQGMKLEESARSFKEFEKLPGWEKIPAVKRGEVFFAAGDRYFYRPGPELIESMAILMSALAGFESAYITPRGSFYKLRWLEMQRHRF